MFTTIRFAFCGIQGVATGSILAHFGLKLNDPMLWGILVGNAILTEIISVLHYIED